MFNTVKITKVARFSQFNKLNKLNNIRSFSNLPSQQVNSMIDDKIEHKLVSYIDQRFDAIDKLLTEKRPIRFELRDGAAWGIGVCLGATATAYSMIYISDSIKSYYKAKKELDVQTIEKLEKNENESNESNEGSK